MGDIVSSVFIVPGSARHGAADQLHSILLDQWGFRDADTSGGRGRYRRVVAGLEEHLSVTTRDSSFGTIVELSGTADPGFEVGVQRTLGAVTACPPLGPPGRPPAGAPPAVDPLAGSAPLPVPAPPPQAPASPVRLLEPPAGSAVIDADQTTPRAAPRFALRFSGGHDIELGARTVFGRDPAELGEGVELVALGDTTSTISKSHLGVTVRGRKVWAEDLRSTNGTERLGVDGSRSELAAGRPTELSIGDVLVLGPHRAELVLL
jgi:hypothetical protein